jgi:CheY-like chemotaxis protein
MALSISQGLVYVTWQIEADNLLLRWEARKAPGIEKMPTSKGFGRYSSAAPSSVSLAVSSPTSGSPSGFLPLFRYRWNVSQAEKLLLRHSKIVGKHRPWARRSPGRVALLNQVSVLIVEDEPFIALDLAVAVEEARGKVIGPAGSVCEALMLIEQHLVQAAILDVNLSDRDVTPIAELLIGGGVPVIFYSGLDLPIALRERYPSAWFCKKPTLPVLLLNKLVASMPK